MKTRQNLRSRLPFALAALPLLIALAGCSGNAQEGGGMAFPAPQVSVVAVAGQNLPVAREYIGQTKGSREVEIRARVGGIIEQRVYEEGSVVKAGQVLFQLDAKPFEAAFAAADAEAARAKAQFAQAERELNRLKPLAAENATSRKELDDAQSAHDLAEAALKAAEAHLREARIQLGYTKVTAPISGVTGLAQKFEGALVNAGTDMLTTLTQTDPMDVYFSVSENEWLARQQELANGSLQAPTETALSVQVKLADGRVLDRVGKVNFNDARIDTETGTVAMRARLPNSDGVLKSGQFVRVVVNGAVRPDAIVVPQKAVLEGPNGKFVYVIGKGEGGAAVAEFRPVEVGEWTGAGEQRAWVIRKGLHDGDQVILDNLIKIRPGAPVQIAAPATADAAVAAAPAS
ncbi:efflux RND transporter periplasmic adaptor subunit [Permianibacter sp. IMCC34836]|uniref:efflux RND transporter periplasmic adaptor subunit n=1 Tax=Permianibacter fluminis TaxID=2738515 RepID=UPI001555DEB1|nr:efflux RND transporter periplasmic adaptor subunit [Permianibacter fluminis]NQD36687.1 efflux RND transporter periplasmic adaptor subunit [Permianibacter fluminis]